MNRTDRLSAIVEGLRAVAPRPRSTTWLASRFEVSRRTIERDVAALQQTGTPIWAEPGRTGGYCLDRAHTLPPVNFTPDEAVAVAVALRGIDGSPFGPAGGVAPKSSVYERMRAAGHAGSDLPLQARATANRRAPGAESADRFAEATDGPAR